MSFSIQLRKPVLVYLFLTVAFSSVVWMLTLNAPDAGRIAGRIYGYGIMWCPALATLITCRLFGKNISGLAWSWGPVRYLVPAYLIPLGYTFVAYLIIWATGLGRFYNEEFVSQAAHELGWESLHPYIFIALFFVVQSVVGMFGSMSTALGEEIGWRGFLVPELSRQFGYTGTSLISGFIWAIWHYPLLVFGHYNNGTPAWYGLTCFTVFVVSTSFVYTWYRLKSGSLWTGVMLHASHNLFIQSIFTPMTDNTGYTAWFSDEFGIVAPVITIFIAIYFWRRRKELSEGPPASKSLSLS